jgi:thiamine pyrophosphate-dependent acetolactate synthase large subunit-like protein
MNGAESLVHSLLKSGVDTCFCNLGTSEMHFVAALDRVPGATLAQRAKLARARSAVQCSLPNIP